MLKRSRERGDTIVEVLLALAVIGAVLGGAYVVVNSNIRNNQAAQERSAAVKASETQLELLRSYVTTNPLPAAGEKFCLVDAGSSITKQPISSALPAPDNASLPTECLADDGGVVDRYAVGIQADSNNRFTVYTSWDGLTGGRSQASIAYKVYP